MTEKPENSSNSFRRAVVDDVDALADLINSAYRGDASRRGWTSESELLGGQRTDPDQLRGMLAGTHEVMLV